jgi:hypothetical protein
MDLLTPAERDRLKRLPAPMPDEDRRVFFPLADRDIEAVHKQRGPPHPRGGALQLWARRYLGCAPAALGATPWPAGTWVAQQ